MTPLHLFGEFVRQQLQSVPMPLVRLLFVASLLILLIWVLRLPKSVTTPTGGAKRWDENLKTGAAIALVIQIALYTLL